MPINSLSYAYPVPLTTKGLPDVADAQVAMNHTNPVAAIAIGSFLIISSGDANSYDAFASSDDVAAYQVINIWDPNWNAVTGGYVSSSDLATGVYHCDVIALGGRVWVGTEDAVGGKIATSAYGYYTDLAVGTPTNYTSAKSNIDPFSPALANILIDSSGVNSSATGKTIQLRGLAPFAGCPVYSDANPSAFAFTWIAPQASITA